MTEVRFVRFATFKEGAGRLRLETQPTQIYFFQLQQQRYLGGYDFGVSSASVLRRERERLGRCRRTCVGRGCRGRAWRRRCRSGRRC